MAAAGDLDMKGEAYEGLWRCCCSALQQQQLLHASLLPAALLLLQSPAFIQRLLSAWTRAFVSKSGKINKYVKSHIIKYEQQLLQWLGFPPERIKKLKFKFESSEAN